MFKSNMTQFAAAAIALLLHLIGRGLREKKGSSQVYPHYVLKRIQRVIEKFPEQRDASMIC